MSLCECTDCIILSLTCAAGHTECVHLLEGHTLDNHTHNGHTPSDTPPRTVLGSHTPTDEREMSMAEAYVTIYNDPDSVDSKDITDSITQLSISDYTFTPSPPNRFHQSHAFLDHAHTGPSPRQKLVYSPPDSAESADSRHHGDDSVLYMTATDESLMLDKPANLVGVVKRGGVNDGFDKESPLNGTYVVDGPCHHSNGQEFKKGSKVDKEVDQLCNGISRVSSPSYQTGKTSCTCYTPSPLECSFVADIKVRIPESLRDLSDAQLREKLVSLGERPGPITPSTKVAYLAYLAKLEAGVQPPGNKGYKGERDGEWEFTHCLAWI